MLNKKSDDGFDAHDEDILAMCAQKVADDLADRFIELLQVGDQMCGSAIFVPGTTDSISSERRGRFGDPTNASMSYAESTANAFEFLNSADRKMQ